MGCFLRFNSGVILPPEHLIRALLKSADAFSLLLVLAVAGGILLIYIFAGRFYIIKNGYGRVFS